MRSLTSSPLNPVFTLLICFLAALTLANAQSLDAVMEAARGWTDAAVRQDASALKRYLADDLQYAHAGGQRQNKEEYIAAVMKGASHYESFVFSDVNVRFYGGAAVLTAFVDVKLTGRDSFRVRTLQVYTQKDDHWQMAAHQSTRLNQ